MLTYEKTVTSLRRHSRAHINIKNPVVPSLPLRINTRKPESVAEQGLFCLLFCSQCGRYRNRTRPTWHFSWDCQLPMLRGRLAATSPTKVSAVVENVSGKQMCPKITGSSLGDGNWKKIFLKNCGKIDKNYHLNHFLVYSWVHILHSH